MPRLFSYCIPYDDGAAPNPFWGACTLVICKPVIRRVAEEGDWVVGTGSAEHNALGKVVYAMRVTHKMSMPEYDEYCRFKLPNKLPDQTSRDRARLVGDCIYDFTSNSKRPNLRDGVHSQENMQTDLRGANALLSTDYWYFGRAAIALPEELRSIVKHGQGHRSNSNAPYLERFVKWIRGRKAAAPGTPQLWGDPTTEGCGARRARDDAEDIRIGTEDL